MSSVLSPVVQGEVYPHLQFAERMPGGKRVGSGNTKMGIADVSSKSRKQLEQPLGRLPAEALVRAELSPLQLVPNAAELHLFLYSCWSTRHAMPASGPK